MRQSTDSASDERGGAAPAEAAGPLARLRGVVLLSGSVRATQLSRAIGTSLLQLPIEPERDLYQCWQREVATLAAELGRPALPVRMMFDHHAQVPGEHRAVAEAPVSIERDPYDYRGTGGVLRDLAVAYEPDELLLIGNGVQLLLHPLRRLAEELASLRADVGLVAHRDGTPTGLMLARCGALQSISETGFIDMKEQALPRIAEKHEVRVCHYDRPTGLPLGTLPNYISALRLYHQHRLGDDNGQDPYREDLHPTFALVQPGAEVDASARLHDSVVLDGARVEPGAVVVRSVVCAGATVGRNRRVVDRLVGGSPRGNGPGGKR